MLHIRRQNNSIQYAFEPYPIHKTIASFNVEHSILRPTIGTKPSCVRMDKWYIANNVLIGDIIDAYITCFNDFVSTHPKYTVQMDEHEFRKQMVKKLYHASESRKKNFV